MDLAIGVAVGSSIQIALFITPVIVLLGWILQKDMSLYFSLFETVSLFVSAFIVGGDILRIANSAKADVQTDQFPDTRWEDQLFGGGVVDRRVRDYRSGRILLPRFESAKHDRRSGR